MEALYATVRGQCLGNGIVDDMSQIHHQEVAVRGKAMAAADKQGEAMASRVLDSLT